MIFFGIILLLFLCHSLIISIIISMLNQTHNKKTALSRVEGLFFCFLLFSKIANLSIPGRMGGTESEFVRHTCLEKCTDVIALDSIVILRVLDFFV